MDALTSVSLAYSSYSADRAGRNSEKLHGRDHAPGQQGRDHAPGPNAWGHDHSSASEQAIDRIIEIILRMQEDDEGGQEQPDVTEINGNILSANGTDADDDMTFAAISVFSLTARGGNDTMTVKAASLTSLQSGDGNDQINVAALFMSEIDAGDGDDTIEMAGRLASFVEGGAGDDTIRISAATIFGVSGGDGNDNVYLEGSRIFAAGGPGNDILTIKNGGDRPAELSFARGDGQDVINANGPITIRFTMTQFNFSMTSSGQPGYGPDELDISFSSLSIMIASKDGTDSLAINFTAGSLSGEMPKWDFEMDKGDYLMKIS